LPDAFPGRSPLGICANELHNSIIHGDGIAEISQLADQSIHLILSDISQRIVAEYTHTQ
jgi:DNA modification methylase